MTMTIGEYIRKRRHRLGLSQATVARRCRTNQGCVSQWERDVNTPDLASLAKIAAALEIAPLTLAAAYFKKPAAPQQPEPEPEPEPQPQQ